tara:strand:- start:24628 stop:28260 length:3633 start_codon:yes stop_codon:yes gene_type:complete
MIFNKKKENFSQLVDNTFNILDIKNELHNLKCNNNDCDIKIIDINYSVINNNKSIYYITNNNDIFILQTSGGLSKSRINILEDIDITAISYTNDYNYGFIATKSKISGNTSIYYTNNKSNNWNKLNFDENYDTTNELINKYSEYCEIDKENIDKLTLNKYTIDNIVIETTLSNGKEIPNKIIFTTFGKDNILRLDNKIYRSETTIQSILLFNENDDFDANIDKEFVFKSNLLKYYLFENSNENFVKHRKINKIINDKNNENYIVFIKNYTELQLENYEIIAFNKMGNEFYYDLTQINNTYIIDLKYYTNLLNNKSFLIGILKNKKNVIIIDLNNTNTISNNTLLNTYSLQPKKVIVEKNLINSYKINITHSVNEIYNYDSDEKIKLFDIDYNYILLNEEDKATYYDLYVVSTDNVINIITFDNNLNMYDKEIKKLDYPKEHIKYINYIGIHKKQNSSHENSIIISNNKSIFIFRENKWNKIDNFNSEYSKLNKTKFISNIDDSNKLIFNGDNTTDRKIYKINFDEDKYVDLLIVGGGGGGGYGGGGGGAGDAKYFNNIKFTKGTYDITVGSGGISGIIESNSNGKQGFNSSIEKTNDSKFDRIIVAGGGGGGGFNTTHSNTPVFGIIGDAKFSSGGGGGAGKKNAIGGLGNGISGNGGSSLFLNNNLYGGGGGGSGFNLERYNIYDNIEQIYEGLTPTSKNIGYGGVGSKIDEIYEYDKNYIVSIGGNGGYYGTLNDENEEDFTNKYGNYINKNINIVGKGADGSIVITNTTDLSKKFKNISSRGSPGIVILVTSKNENDDEETNNFQENTGDNIVNYYSIIDRDLNKEYKKELSLTKLKFKNRIKQNKLEKEKIITERGELKKNIYELEIREKDIMTTKENNNKLKFNDPISDSYLPYHTNIPEFNRDNFGIDNEIQYKIIRTYKELLYRQPTSREINEYKIKIKNYNITMNDIRKMIINSDEYKTVISMQNNDTNRLLVYNSQMNDLHNTLADNYYKELNEEMPNYLLKPVTSVYKLKLGYNKYMLRALYVNSKFNDFKDDIRMNKDINENNIKMIYDKYFTTKDLKDKANDILRYDKYHKLDNKEEFDEKNKYDNFKQTDKNYDDLKVDTDISLDSLNFNSDTLNEAFNNSTPLEENELDRKLNEYKEERDEFNEENGHIIEKFMTNNRDTHTHSLENALKPLIKPVKKLFSMKKNFFIDATNNFNN